jgi:hypothetical protein
MAKYSESDKKKYLKYKKKVGSKAMPFGAWLRDQTTGSAYGDTAKELYRMSDKSKRNRGKMYSSKKDRP